MKIELFSRWVFVVLLVGLFASALAFAGQKPPAEPLMGTSQLVGGRLEIASSASPSVAARFATSDSTIPDRHDFDGKSWWEHVKFLADDKLEGRDTGSRGEREAEKYAVEQLRKAGAEPAGIDGFYQPVKFVSRQIVEKDSSRIRRRARFSRIGGPNAIMRLPMT